MKQRFFVDIEWSEERHIVRDQELYHQLRAVLRLEEGDGVIVCDGKGMEAAATLTRITKNEIEFVLEGEPYATPVVGREVTLCVALLKLDKFEWVVQKATEAGVGRIVPLRAKRTVKQSLRRDRIEKIIKEAAEQSGRGTLPIIDDSVKVEDLGDTIKNQEVLFCDVGKGESLLSVGLSGPIAIVIGPEGGWDESERAYAATQGWRTVSLGDLTLRAETAAVVASFIAVHG